MRLPSRIVLVAAFFAVGITAATTGQAQTGPLTIQGTVAPGAGTVVTTFGQTVHNQIRVDGDKSSTVDNRSGGLTVTTNLRPVHLRLGVTSMSRDIEDQRAGTETSKSTQIATPAIGMGLSPDTSILAGLSVIRTKTDNDAVDSGSYDLNTRRAFLNVTRTNATGETRLTVASEARAEHAFDLYGYPMIDRDYVPLQVDLDRKISLSDSWRADGGIRYSHYNNDVYKDQYDADVPKTPTLAQVFDYLLTLKAGVTYAINNAVSVRSEVKRKAALDTDSYQNTEYLVGLAGGIGALFKIGESASLGVGFETSSGKKTHEVQGQSYAYADQRRELQVSVGAAL